MSVLNPGFLALNRKIMELPPSLEGTARYTVMEFYGYLAAQRCTLVPISEGWEVYVPTSLRV